MKRERIITANTTLDDIDLVDTYIKCNSETAITLTLPAVSAPKIGADSIIVNFGAGTVTVASVDIVQGGHGHIVCDNGTSWKVALGGGGGETDPLFTASAAAEIDNGDISNWNDAYVHSNDYTRHPTIVNDDQPFWNGFAWFSGSGVNVTEEIHPGPNVEATKITISRYEPLVNGDPDNPEVMFDDDGDIIMVEV